MNPLPYHSSGLVFLLGSMAFLALWVAGWVLWYFRKLVIAIGVGWLLCSCELPSTYLATSSSQGNSVMEKRWGQIGGTRSSSRSDGSSEVNNYENSLKDAATAVLTYGLGKVSAGVQKAKDASDAATVQQAQQQSAALAAQKEANAAAAAAGEVTPVGAGASVLKGATLYTAPK